VEAIVSDCLLIHLHNAVTITRRRLLQAGAVAAAGLSAGHPLAGPMPPPRLVCGEGATPQELWAARDAANLLGRALGAEVAANQGARPRPMDWLVGCPETTSWLRRNPDRQCTLDQPGAFRLQVPAGRRAPSVVVAGRDPEGARRGLYRLLEELGFGFFRDGERLPEGGAQLPGSPHDDLQSAPAFQLRGEMLWNRYLGPRRYCPAAWGTAHWERALLHAARAGHNTIEFYPPLAHVYALALPELSRAPAGALWTAGATHELARASLARGRDLGLRFMVALEYGVFPGEVAAAFPGLSWRGGFLCASQPELKDITRRCWSTLLDEFGSDGLFAIRHRGEEGQSYSNPCQDITKAEGYRQGIALLRELEPEATVTVWTWAESPQLFDQLPDHVRAFHVRHGLGGVFDDRGRGREQADGRPPLAPGRRWWSGPFTVFGGNEVALRTGWSDPTVLAADARAAAGDPDCEAYLQWPEWADCSPLVSEVIARLARDPGAFDPAAAVEEYARCRHGSLAEPWLSATRPLLEAGNARFMKLPSRRALVPWWLSPGEHRCLEGVRQGVAAMMDALHPHSPTPAFERDLSDLLCWALARQASVLELAAWLSRRDGSLGRCEAYLDGAEDCWSALHQLLAVQPELSLVETACAAAAEAPLSLAAVDHLWELGCDFYGGYPLVLGPEAVELVYLPQHRAFAELLRQEAANGGVTELEQPGWFWNDFPDPAWEAGVRLLPRSDAAIFEAEVRGRLQRAIVDGSAARGAPSWADLAAGRCPPHQLRAIDRDVLEAATGTLLSTRLPDPLTAPPA